jgi:hypothetical protein
VRARLHMLVLDIGDGYERSALLAAPVALFNALLVPISYLARRMRPLKA